MNMDNMPWDHAEVSFAGLHWTRLVQLRWPRLHRAIQRQGNLSVGEASNCLRAYREDSMPVAEAVDHYGGPCKLIADAIKNRHLVTLPY